MTDKRKDCPMRHENGNCTVAGGFCTAVNNPICEALHNAFDCGHLSALRKQETVTNRNGLNEPLTLNELREMVGEPVWCKELECYGIIKIETIGRFANTPFLIGVYHDFDLGTAVNFEYDIKRRHFSLYRQKPEEGTV